MARDSLEIGDEATVVITDTNEDSSRDPVSEIDGVVTFVRFPDDRAPEFGESVRVRIADMGETHNVAVALDRE